MDARDIRGEMDQVDDLTWREQDVLLLLAKRLTNREIGERLHLAETTVKDYVSRILSKLYVKNRREAVKRALELGLMDEGKGSGDKALSNFPSDPIAFVGRVKELDDIREHLANTRLLSLTGPGGVGKTRLAIKAAEAASTDFKDGIFFVALAPIQFIEDITQTIAEALRFPLATHENPKDQLIRYLKDRQLLLVMDNFEHLLDGAGLVGEMLSEAAGLKIIATSRELLNLHGETNISVGGLQFGWQGKPEDIAKNDAAALFLQSGSMAQPGFSPEPSDLVQISHICEKVQGLPLAIELAAAWLHILNIGEIVEELEKGLDILSSQLRDIPERHRSIRSVFDHSWHFLDHKEQMVFMQLSIFQRGFSKEAALFVSDTSLEMLAGLVNKSFLKYDPHSGRFAIHELLRQYAKEQLENEPETRRKAQEMHAAFFADFMHQRWQHLKDARQLKALADIEADIENVRSGWRYCLSNEKIPAVWKYIHCLWHVYWIKWWNHAGMELFGNAASAIQGFEGKQAKELLGAAMAYKSYFMGWLGLGEEGYKIARESVKLLQDFGPPEALIFAYRSMTVNAYFLSGFSEETETIDKMVRLSETAQDKWLEAFSMFAPSLAKLIEGDYVEAQKLAETNLALCNELGDQIGAAFPLIALGHAALLQEDFETAKEHYLRCLEISKATEFPYALQTSSKYLGKVALTLGELAEAEEYLASCLIVSKEIGLVRDIIILVYEYARLNAIQGKPERAVELLSLVIRHPVSSEYRLLEGRIRDGAEELRNSIQGELPPASFEAALTRGQALDLDETVRFLLKIDQPDD